MSKSNSPLETTTIGSFPKPKFVPVRDWFDISRETGGMNSSQTTTDYTADIKNVDERHEPLFIRAAKEVIEIQLRSGVSIPTDGEVRRENYIHYHCRHLDGFDFDNLENRVLRDGAYETDLPAIRSTIAHSGRSYGAHDYRASQSVSPRPVKFTLPGPLTIMDTTADCFYNDRPRLNAVLAETVNREILALVDAGCQYIQVDELLFGAPVPGHSVPCSGPFDARIRGIGGRVCQTDIAPDLGPRCVEAGEVDLACPPATIVVPRNAPPGAVAPVADSGS